MDNSFAERWEKGRLFDVTIQGVKYHLRRPTYHQVRAIGDANRIPGTDEVHGARAARQIVAPALLGWSGMTEKMIDPENGTDEPLPFTEMSKQLFLDERQDLVDLISTEILVRHTATMQKVEDSVKNSASVSTGS